MSRDRDDDRRGRDRDRGDDRRGRDRDDDRRGDDRRSRDRDDDRGSRSRDRDRDDDRGGRGSGSGRRYEYRERSAEETKERGERGGGDYDKLLKPGVKLWKTNDGENRIRILPPTWDGAKHYGLDVKVHYSVGPDKGSYLCPRKHGGGTCPVCDERDEARQEDNPDEQYVKDLEAKSRVLVYIIDRDHEKEGVQAWFMPWGVDKDITKISVDKDSGSVLSIDHPERGFDVMFDKSGTGIKTKYEGISIARRESPLGRDEWLDHAMDNPLPDQLNVFDHDHIAKAFGAKGQQRDSRARERDRDDDRRGSRDRDDDRHDDRRDDRRGDRDDERGRGRDERGGRERDDRGRREERGRDRERDDEPTWESVHAMTRTEMEDLVELKDLPIKPKQAKDDDDLADWICEEMKLTKSEGRDRRREDDPPKDRGDDRDSRMNELRRRRAD